MWRKEDVYVIALWGIPKHLTQYDMMGSARFYIYGSRVLEKLIVLLKNLNSRSQRAVNRNKTGRMVHSRT